MKRVLSLLARDWPLLLATVSVLAAMVLPPLPATRVAHRLLISFDISQSMGVEDVALDGQAVSRLTLAKAAAARLVSDLPCGSRVGWAAFAERRSTMLVTPLDVCEHYDAILASLDELDGRMRWGEASGIGKGLHQLLRAAHALDDETDIILFSDGEEQPALKSGQSGLPKSEELGIDGMLVGVGGDTPLPIPKVDRAGRQVGYWLVADADRGAESAERQPVQVLSRLDGEHMAALARLAELHYVRLDGDGGLQAALDASGLGKPTRLASDWRWLPALLSLCFLCWRFAGIGRGR